MSPDDLRSLTITGAGRLLRARKLSSMELTRACLDRIQQLDGTLKAFITVTADLALAQARRADREIAKRAYRGPLHGIPVTLKDIYCTRGIRTTAGRGSSATSSRAPTPPRRRGWPRRAPFSSARRTSTSSPRA